jgi:pimeloyl-ACP methyl ester carboxylesterase
MQFRCPTCGFRGSVRIPAHLPRGHRATVRCPKCRRPFVLALGRLFPQPSVAAYAALIPGSRACRGERVGSLWLEVTGPESDRTPLLAFPSHPAFSHELMHDLLDPFRDYFRVGYLELPGTRRNPAGPENREPWVAAADSLAPVLHHLGVRRVHLLGHLASCPTALEVAREHPEAISSLVLIDPDLGFAERLGALRGEEPLAQLLDGDMATIRRQDLALSLVERVWSSPPGERARSQPRPGGGGPRVLSRLHRQGLAGILAAGLAPERLRRELVSRRSAVSYSRLARLRMPVLLFSGRDSPEPLQGDALFLESVLPSAELAPLERGGAWSAWLTERFFANKLLAHKRSSERQGRKPLPRPKRVQTLAGQPLGWMSLLYLLLIWGLTLGLHGLTFQPAYMAKVLPPLLGGVLPILWFLLPRRLRLLRFLRFRALRVGNLLPPLAVGALLGVAFRLLLLSQGGLEAPAAIPDALLSLSPGTPGHTAAVAALAASALFAFGVAGNLLILRRAAGGILVPALLFALTPLSYPDLLWQIPAAVAMAVLFARRLSIFPPLALLAGLGAADRADVLYAALPFPVAGSAGLVAAAAAFGAAVLLALLFGRRAKRGSGNGVGGPHAAHRSDVGSGGRRKRRERFSPWELYYTTAFAAGGEGFRWRGAGGTVLVVFSLIAAAVVVFGFVRF